MTYPTFDEQQAAQNAEKCAACGHPRLAHDVDIDDAGRCVWLVCEASGCRMFEEAGE